MDIMWIWLTLFALGAAHALEPGHGKLLVTSYLTGSQAQIKDAFLLGIIVAIFHTLSVTLLGVIIVFLAFTFFKETFVNSLEMLSGVVILGLGLLLFWRRFLQKTNPQEEHCDCHLLHSTPVEAEQKMRPQSSFKEVVLLGIASGMTPCPVALTALIAAFAMGKIISALGALAVFSAGIGSVLVVLGILLIRGSNTFEARWKRFQYAPVWIAKASTIVVLLLGCYLVTKPFFFPEEHAEEPGRANVLMPMFSNSLVN